MVASKGAKLESMAIKALATAIENSNATGEDAFNCDQLCRLFEPSKKSDALVAGYSVKQQQTLLWNALKNGSTDKSNKNQLKRFFAGLHSIVERIIEDEAYIPKSIKDDKDGFNDNNDNDYYVKPDKKSDERLLVLKCAALAVQAFLQGRIIRQKEKEDQHKRRVPLKAPPQVFQIASALHETLFPLHSCGSPAVPAKTAILSLCETWWLSQAENREALIVQCLPLLVLNASDDDMDAFTKKTHIQRLHKLRDAFGCIDFADPSSDSLRELLLRVASNPVCLQMTEGKKFLAGLLQQDVHLVKDLHKAFRAQIPEAKTSILKSYGEIYHRAWKEVRQNQDLDATEDDEDEEEEIVNIREAIEHEVLQDLMYSLIHMDSPTTFNSVLAVLEPLHADKKNNEVASLLYRLYSPILWRGLSAPNSRIRKNAVVVLEKVFPLQDPMNSLSMKNDVLKATEALEVALKDDDPLVRVAASGATARTCAVFWEILPPQEIRSLLNQIVIRHASDTRSAAVRAAALDAATILLETKKSHGVLRALLPSLGNLIHDKTAKVRLAAARMLLQVKKCPGIRFYHVVPVDHLMARFVAEAKYYGNPRNPITKELTELMLSSYFPQGHDMTTNQLLQRTVSFLLTNPNAASVFYANMVDHVEVEALVKFIVMLLKCLKTCVDAEQANQVKKTAKMKKRRRHIAEDDDSDEMNADDDHLSTSNTPLMASLADAINTLWNSLVPLLEKPKYKSCKSLLEDRFLSNDCLVDILSHFEQKGLESLSSRHEDESTSKDCFRTCSSILSCATRLDKNLTENVVSFVTSSLKSLSKDDAIALTSLVTSYLSFICASGYVEDVTQSLARSIELNAMDEVTLFSPNFEDSVGVRRSRRSSSSSASGKDGMVPRLPSDVAWGILEYVLQGANSQGRAIREAILSSSPATRVIEKSLEKGIKFSERLLADDSIARNFGNEEVEYAIRASEAYGRFALHKESLLVIKNDDNSSMERQVGKLLLWTTNKIVPAFMRSDDEGVSALRDCDLSQISNRLSMSIEHIPPGSPSTMSPPKQKANCGKTPEGMRGHSSLFVTSPNDSPVIYSAKVGCALLLSSCILSSEMLAMGMTNAYEISKAAVQWCQIFDQSRWPIEEHLLCGFIRLAFQLFRASGDTTLIKDLFVKCNSNFKETAVGDLVKKELQSLFRLRNGGDNLLPAFFVLGNRIIEKENIDISLNASDASSEELNDGGSIEIFLDAILGNSGVTKSFALAIANRLLAHDGEITKAVNFDARCLSLVLKEVDDPETTKILRELLTERYDEEGEMRHLVENLLDCSA